MARVPMLVIWPPSRTPLLTLFLISVAGTRVLRFAALLRFGLSRLCSFWCFRSSFFGWLVGGVVGVVFGCWGVGDFAVFRCPRFLSDVVFFSSRLWSLLVVEGFRCFDDSLTGCCIPLEVASCVFLLIGGWVETSLVYPIPLSTRF